MYETILLTLDAKRADRAIIEHVKRLATLAHSRVVLLHIADGWAARTYGPDAISPEIRDDVAYLERIRAEFEAASIPVKVALGYGEPSKRIIEWVRQHGCDLVAMGTHGHGFLADVFLGSTSREVRHSIDVPVLLLRSRGERRA